LPVVQEIFLSICIQGVKTTPPSIRSTYFKNRI